MLLENQLTFSLSCILHFVNFSWKPHSPLQQSKEAIIPATDFTPTLQVAVSPRVINPLPVFLLPSLSLSLFLNDHERLTPAPSTQSNACPVVCNHLPTPVWLMDSPGTCSSRPPRTQPLDRKERSCNVTYLSGKPRSAANRDRRTIC